MAAEVSVEGVRELEAAIGPVIAAYRLDVEERTLRTAANITERAKALAPELHEADPRFYPGELRDSIYMTGMQGDARGKFVAVGTNLRWGVFQEFGTHKMAAHPFLRPAAASVAGGASGAATLVSTTASRVMVRRARLRGDVRRLQRAGRITNRQAAQISRRISTAVRPRRRR